MSELPTILVTNGWKTDRNRKLTSVVIPSTVNTLNAPTKVTFMGTNLTAIPSTAAALQEFIAPNIRSITNNTFYGYTALTSVSFQSLETLTLNATSTASSGIFGGCTALASVSMPNLTTISCNGDSTRDYGIFYNCTSLQAVSFPNLTTISTNGGNGNGINVGGVFHNCTSLASVSMPKLTSITRVTNGGAGGVFSNCSSLTSLYLPELLTITNSYGSMIYGCSALTTINFPKIQTITAGINANSGALSRCTSLTSVTLGSVGHPVSSIGNYVFGNDTQSGLTITIYTTGGASLSGAPWGATNATIVYESA